MRYTDEQLRDFARQVVEVDTQDPDFIGVSEQFEEEWEDLPEEEHDRVHRAVHGLACSAIVTVTFTAEPVAEQPAEATGEPRHAKPKKQRRPGEWSGAFKAITGRLADPDGVA